jgi:hypothetical protein
MHPQASNVYIRFSSFTLITSFTPESMLLNVHFWKSRTYKVQQVDATKALKEVKQTLGEVCHNPSTAPHGSPKYTRKTDLYTVGKIQIFKSEVSRKWK